MAEVIQKEDRNIPAKVSEVPMPEDVLARAFSRIDRLALGMAIGLVAGTSIFAATVILILKGGKPLGPNLALLSQYIPAYSVSWKGSLIGGAGGFVGGFVIGWSIALLRNFTLSFYVFAAAFWERLNRFLDDA